MCSQRWLLNRAEAAWQRLASALSDWDALDEEEQLDYIHEVPLYADYLARLKALERVGYFETDDQGRLQEITAMAKRLRPQLRERTGHDVSDGVLS